MISIRKKVAVAALGAGLALVATPAVAYSAPNTLPAGTKVSAALSSGTTMNFVGIIDGVSITVKCTSFKASGKVPKKAGDKVTLSAPPKITGCTDSLKGTDTIKTNSTNGKWTLSVTSTSPYTMTLTIPKAGATFSSKALSSCVVTAAPSAAAGVTGSYNSSTGTDTVTKAKIPTSGSGCTTSADSTTTATVVLTPNPGAPPF